MPTKTQSSIFISNFGRRLLMIISQILGYVLWPTKVNIWQERQKSAENFQFQPTFVAAWLDWQEAKQIRWFYCSQLFAAFCSSRSTKFLDGFNSVQSRGIFRLPQQMLLYFAFPTFCSINYAKLFKTMKLRTASYFKTFSRLLATALINQVQKYYHKRWQYNFSHKHFKINK